MLAKILDNNTGLVSVIEGFASEEFIEANGYVELEVQKSDKDFNWYLKEKCEMLTDEEKKQKERQELDSISLTRADVERGIYKACGMDFEDVLGLVQDNHEIDIKALKIELKANNFYRGNPYVNQIGAILGFTTKQLDEFFQENDYTKLLSDSEGGIE